MDAKNSPKELFPASALVQKLLKAPKSWKFDWTTRALDLDPTKDLAVNKLLFLAV